jgi:hypothetical protein
MVALVALVLFDIGEAQGQPQTSPGHAQLLNHQQHHVPRLIDDGYSGLKIS